MKKKITKKSKPIRAKKNTSLLKTFSVINPINQGTIGELKIFTSKMVEDKIHLASEAQKIWSKKSIQERGRELTLLRKYISKNREELISKICEETGKTRMDALMEIFTVCDAIKYVVKNTPKILRKQKKNTGLFFYKSAYITHHPFGVVGVISSWNYPLVLSLLPSVYALITGNTVVVKPSLNSSFTTLKISEYFHKAGLQNGIFQVVVGGAETGESIVTSLNTKMISFNGSTETGKKIAEECSKLLKPYLLELDGKDAMIVFKDADLLRAAKACIWGGYFNTGQTCNSIERVYVHKEVLNEFIHYLKEEYKKIKEVYGREYSFIGSMTTVDQKNIVLEQFKDAKDKKAYFIEGGVSSKGLYIEPAIIINANHKMKIMQESTFGPAIAIMEFHSDEEVIRLVNETKYGLGASIFSSNLSHSKKIAERLEVGSVSINDVLSNYLISDLPFGGFKESGIGRVHGKEGILAFTQTQAISYNKSFWNISDELWWYPYTKKIYGYISRIIELLFS
jgi:succinate-semialdehyde dehydrogenase/glutarate-semialdehyde dehydrogenase